MADQKDGSIVIDTELDNSGFEKGSDKLLGAVKDLTGAVDNMGDNMMRSFSQVIPLLQSIATSTSQINSAITSGATQAADANEAVIASEERVAETATQTAQNVQQQYQAIGNTGAAQPAMSQLERQITSIGTSMEGLSQSAEKGFASGSAVLAFDDKLTNMEGKINSAREALDAFGQTKIPTEEYQVLSSEIEKTEQKLFSLFDRQDKMEATGVSKNSQAWKSLQYDIQETTTILERWEAAKARMEADGSAFTMGSDTAQYGAMQATLDRCSESLDRNRKLINSEAIEQQRLNVLAAQEKVEAAGTGGQRERAMEKLREAQQKLQNIAAQSSLKPPEKATSGWARFGNILKGVGSVALKTAGAVAKVSFKAIASGAKTAANKLKNFIKQSKSSTLSAKSLVKALTSVKTMLISRVKRMFISSIVNSVKEGMSSLAQFSSEFDSSMSNIKNGAKELAANLTVSLGSAIQAIEPIITNVLNAITKAVSYLNALIASISGKSTVTVAKKQMDSYAASTSDAAGAAKELNRQTMGFDELNKMSDDKSSDGSGGGALFEEQSIESLLPDDVASVFDRIKEAFQNGDWAAIGSIIAGGLNSAVSSVDNWINGTLRPKAVQWAGNIGNLLNGLVSGLDWGNVGKTISDGANTVFDTLNTFLTTFNFQALGTGLGDAINGIFDNLDFGLIGQTFANKWNALIDFVFGLVTTIKWDKIGDSLSDMVNGFTERLNLDKAAQGIGAFVNGVFTALGQFIKNTNWGELATKLGDGINTLFTSIDWSGAIVTLVEGFNSIVRALSTFITTVDWYSIGKNLMTAIVDGIKAIDWGAAGKLLSDAVIGLLDLLLGVVGETDWGALLQDILAGIGELLANIDWGQILAKIGALVVELVVQIPGLIIGAIGGIADLLAGLFKGFGLDSIAGFFSGIGDAMRDAGKWLKENLVDPVVNWVKDLFGIHSPSTVFSEIGDWLIQGLLNGISAAWEGIKTFFSDAISGLTGFLSGAWDDIKSTAVDVWNGLKDGVTGAFDSAKTWLSDTADGIGAKLSSTWDTVKSTASEKWDSLKTTVGNAFTNAKNAVSTTADTLKTNLSTAWNNVKSTASTAWTNVKTTVSDTFNSAKTAVVNTAENIKSNLSTAWNSAKSTATQTWNGIKSSISSTFTNLKTNLSTTANNIKSAASDAWTNIKSTASTKWNDIKSTVSSKWDSLKTTMKNTNWSEIGNNLVSGVKNGISNAWSGLSSWFSSKWDSLVGGVKDFLGIHSPSRVFASIGDYMIQGLQIGMESEMGTALRTAANIASTVTDTFDEASPELTISENATVTSLDRVADRLSSIASTFRTITSLLDSMGGLQIPQIAAGTVVPAKTRIAETPIQNDDDDKPGNYMDVSEILAAMMAGFEAVVKAIQDKDSTVNIDDDTIGKAASRWQKKQAIMQGG